MNRGRIFFTFILPLLVITSCLKPAGPGVAMQRLRITLTAVVTSDSVVSLSWSGISLGSVSFFTLVKTNDTNNATHILLKALFDTSVASFVDVMPITPYYAYYVVARVGSTDVISNVVTVNRKNVTFLNLSPYNVLIDHANENLIFYSLTGEIALYNLVSETVTRKIETGVPIANNCELGTYAGRSELYVPRSDGWLYIYDAFSLSQVDQVYLGFSASSVVYNGGILFIPNYTLGDSIYAFSRALRTRLYAQQDGDTVTRFYVAPNTQTKLFGFYSNGVALYNFDTSGRLLATKYPAGNYPGYDQNICSVFPDGWRLITSATGLVYDTSLSAPVSLPRRTVAFSSFDFDNTHQLIYAGTNTDTVQAYAMSNYQLVKSLPTKYPPFKVFFNFPWVVAVCMTPAYSSTAPENCFVQKLVP